VATRATKWTDEKVKAQKLPEGLKERRVLVEPGLYLFMRLKADGQTSKQWQYRAQVDGKRRWLSLGSYPEITLFKAGEERRAHDRVHEAAKKGEADHPALVARQNRKAAKAQPTVSEVFDEMVEDKRMGSSRKGGVPVRERTITVLRESFEGDIESRIGDSKVAKLTRDALQGCIDAPRKRSSPGAAAHVYRTLRGLISFAIKRGYIEGADPMRGIENPRPYRPAPVVAASDAEIVALLAELDKSRLWPSTKLAIEFQLLTGARPTEIRMATWGEMKTDRAVWVIPAERFKTDREHRIHLSKQALAVLDRARAHRPARTESGKPDYVFPGAKGAAMEKMAVARALSRMAARTVDAGGKKLRPHDVRRTLRTLMSRIGIAPHVAELCIGHIEKETMRRVYDGHDYWAEMVDAWDRAGAHIEALRNGGAIVIPIAKHMA
jgi:integrase